MHPPMILVFLRLLPLVLSLHTDSPLDCIARKTVPYHRDNGRMFREEGVWNYSTMLLREDLGLLLLGARENIYAVDINDISKKMAAVSWKVSDEQQNECSNKGKNLQIDCLNYIRLLHTMEDGRMYVCGTNAFNPECDHMSYTDGKLILEGKVEDGKGKCPFDPFQRHSSILIGEDLFSATSMNFLGSEPVIIRSSPITLRTEFKSSWLNEPTFISMAQLPESENSGDDDKVYLFFSETAVEYDFYTKLVVSRVARVCKGDLGGERTLQKKWTSFLKARVDCPVLDSPLPYVIQDTFLWCDPAQGPAQDSCIFYAVFTPQSDTKEASAVCGYRVSDIGWVFSQGKYKTPVTVETSFVKWVMYSGEVPSPRPGACIDSVARSQGINRSLDLPDRTLQFVRDRPLMDPAVQPIGDRPLLVWRGAALTRIVVHTAQALDGEKHKVMFIGTEQGSVVKALNVDGQMFVIEEVRLFPTPEPIKALEISGAMLYAGSEFGAVQMPLSSCGRSLSCVDCVLARDPYCGWDKTSSQCTSLLSSTDRGLIQSVKIGNASLCPNTAPVQPVNLSVQRGGNLKLLCPAPSNLAEISWLRDGQALPASASASASAHHQLLRDGLLIRNATPADAARYRCLTRERSPASAYTAHLSEYRLSVSEEGGGGAWGGAQAQRGGPSLATLRASVGVLGVLLVALLGWNFYKGHLPLPWGARRGGGVAEGAGGQGATGQGDVAGARPEAGAAESKPLVSGAANCGGNNNHAAAAGAESTGGEGEGPTEGVALQYIDEESEI